MSFSRSSPAYRYGYAAAYVSTTPRRRSSSASASDYPCAYGIVPARCSANFRTSVVLSSYEDAASFDGVFKLGWRSGSVPAVPIPP